MNELAKKPLIVGERIYLRKLELSDKSQQYLNWLNDPQVQKYTRRRGRTLTMKDIEDFLQFMEFSRDYHCAIITVNNKIHIGNISINSIDELNKSAEISIMIGDKNYWGKGYGKDAIELATKYAFENLKLHRIWAESPNPAFNKMIEKMGWMHESVAREGFLFEGKFFDNERWSILENEYAGKK